jgi:hypothetical protein
VVLVLGALLGGGGSALPAMAATQPVDLKLHCLSPRFAAATTRLFGLDYVLELTTGGEFDGPNGELSASSGTSDFTHGGVFKLTDPTAFEPIFFGFVLSVPPFVDANQNGIHDFYEVSQAVSNARSTGAHDDFAGGAGAINATWTRAADSKAGTCRLQLPSLGLTFTHAFELIEFAGPLTYTAQGDDRVCSVELKQTGDETVRLSGPLLLTRVSQDELRLRGGVWLDARTQEMAFDSIDRAVRTNTHYLSLFHFLDGNLDTAWADYDFWALQLTDPNDGDQDGVPDFTDIPAARRPVLALAKVADTLALTIRGDIGRTLDIERTATLSPPDWGKILSIVLTSDPQVVPLSLPPGSPAFFRAKAP